MKAPTKTSHPTQDLPAGSACRVSWMIAGLLLATTGAEFSGTAQAQDATVRANLGGTAQLLSLSDPRIVREIVPNLAGNGLQTNYWVRTGVQTIRSSIEYPIPSDGAVTASAMYGYDAQAQSANGLEVSWAGKQFVIDSFALRATPQYGDVSVYNGVSYPQDTSRYFAYNLYQWKTAQDAIETQIRPRDGAASPNTIPGRRNVERYVSQGAMIAVSDSGKRLAVTEEGDGRILIRAEHSGSMVMLGTGLVSFSAETPLFFNFAGFRLKTSSAPNIPEMRSIFINSEGDLLYNDTRPSWRSAGAYSLPMSTTLSEVVPAELVAPDPNGGQLEVTRIQLLPDNQVELGFRPDASVQDGKPAGIRVQGTEDLKAWRAIGVTRESSNTVVFEMFTNPGGSRPESAAFRLSRE